VGLIITVNSQEKGICFDFLKGLCTRGLLCRFSHDIRNLQTPQCTVRRAARVAAAATPGAALQRDTLNLAFAT
jgi:hypothetical protein